MALTAADKIKLSKTLAKLIKDTLNVEYLDEVVYDAISIQGDVSDRKFNEAYRYLEKLLKFTA